MINELKRQKRIHGLSEEITEVELKQLNLGVPIQKIIGFIEFDDVKINVNRNVLIPRYETEEVMRKSLNFIDKNSRVLDLCCGSGYIGLSIKKKKNCEIVLSDIDDESIIQTQENAKMNNLDVQIIKSDMFENIKGKFDLIISNPPYIPSSSNVVDSVLRHEPSHALFAGVDGNDFYKIIIKEAPKFLKKSGVIILEISEDNVDYLLDNKFHIEKDINQKPRIAWRIY